MHLLPADTRSLDAAEAAVDLGLSPGDLLFLSFTDSDLALAAATRRDDLRIAPLYRLKHPMSVDLCVDSVGRGARAILVRLLGGLDYWRYGAEELAAAARESGASLAFIPGDGFIDERLVALSTVPRAELDRLEAYWKEGGAANAIACFQHLAALAGLTTDQAPAPRPLSRHGFFAPGKGAVCRVAIEADWSQGKGDPRPRAALVFYRSLLLADDVAPVEALAAALQERGFDVLPLFVGSLKDEETAIWIKRQLAALRPDVILNLTAFSARRENGATALDGADCPVLQIIVPTADEAAWEASSRGLSATDLAMHVVLPEIDGRLLAGIVSFKAEDISTGFSRIVHAPKPDRVASIADKAAAFARLRRTATSERRIGLVLSNYPGAGGRAGHAVGLDVPSSTLAILYLLAAAGYAVADQPENAAALMAALAAPTAVTLPLEAYRRWLATLSDAARAKLDAAWGDAAEDPACVEGAFQLDVILCGAVAVAIQQDRGRALDAKRDHHDPDLAPRHAYLAFYLWLREHFAAHAMIHLGTHGTLEWLPGKAAALSSACFPELAVGALPVIYPFIANNPGEAAQAKRRIGALTLGHLTPPLATTGLQGEAVEVERLIDEYAAADGLDSRRMVWLRREIIARAAETGLAAECGITPGMGDDDALARLDAFLCDVKDLQIRDGLHVFGALPADRRPLVDALARAGQTPRPTVEALLAQSAEGERAALLAALDGRFVPPGPAGAPTRGRLDVLPTGRNLTTLDPRSVPTRAAHAIGLRAAAELARRHQQDHGEHLSRVVIDLWGSSTLRTGGDDFAQALALMGVAPTWDSGSNRVSGFEILPIARLHRPRVDVTLKISGLFRDVFAMQIALFDQAAQAVAALDEDDDWNPLAAARRAGEARALRIFGAAPAAYGPGVADRITTGDWQTRAELGRDYIAAGGYAYGINLEGLPAHAAFEARVAAADAFWHGQDHKEIDILDAPTFAASEGGFAAALEALGASAALYHADLSDPLQPKVRTLDEEVARVARGRAANPAWIAGMMRHGYQGAGEMANAVDSLFAFAATAGVVTDAAFDALHAAYLEDDAVRSFLEKANPAAARAIRDRFAEALQRGLWKTRRNSVARTLEAAE
jgi:cobaltochelatase CobN